MASTPKIKRKPSKRRPAGTPGAGLQSAKKKKPTVTLDLNPQEGGNIPESAEIEVERIPVFKDPYFMNSRKGATGNKKMRLWKNLKLILAAERLLPWKPGDALYGSVEALPSFWPAKKYSDMTGLLAKYTDPQTKLLYTTLDEYFRIRMLPQDIVSGLLALRRANVQVP